MGTSFFSTNNAFFPLPTPSLSVSSFNSNTIKLYPNPFVNTFKLELEEMNENVSININDLTGKSVYNKTFSELKDLDIQLNMSSGLYVIDVKQNGESRKFKVVKK
ncbi:T9SS type A sorting domain-containing protein [Flavobacterium sp. PS2]|uniref:T9SS type A sorting domain-containing protein n=1 Tax=Flavobacterium sp. PS2 TaxID=3384157 RepID=UPI00390C426A